MSTVIRTIPAILAALFAATATLTANAADRSWNAESTGGSEMPYNIWDTSSAGWNASIGNGNNLHFNLAEKTYFNSESGNQIASDFDVDSGDYVFTGPLKFLALKAGAANSTVSIAKKNGNWTVHQWGFFLGNSANSTVVFTNVSGNVTAQNPQQEWLYYIGYAAGSYAKIVNLSGDWTFPKHLLLTDNASATGIIETFDGTWTISNGNLLCIGNKGRGEFIMQGGALNASGTLRINDQGNGTLTVNGGSVTVGGNLEFGNSSGNATGTLTIKGGNVSVASAKCVQFTKGTGTINLDGGTLTTKQVKTNGGTGTLNFNGGTLKANAVADDGLIKSGVTVNVGAGGGTIDCNGNDITIRAALGQSSDTGGMTFTGGNGNTISFDTEASIRYKGITTITPGTRLAHYYLGNSKNVISNGIVVAGMPAQGDVIFTCTRGGGYTLKGVNLDNVKCPLAPNTKFELDASNTNIVVTSVGQTINYWTGAIDNDLGKAGNWSNNTVPNGENACIFSTNAVTLTKGSDFTPTAITFLEGSAAVTINGDDFHNIVAVTNLSSVSHTINAKVYFAGDIQVKQAAMAETGDLSKAHVTFAGGAFAAAGCSLESGNYAAVYSRCIFGKYYLAPTSVSPWTAQYQGSSKRVCVADGSYLDVPYAGNVSELYVGTGAKVVIGDMNTTSRPSCQVKGEMAVTNELNVTIGGNVFLDYDNGSGDYKFEKIVLGSSQTGSWVFFNFGDQGGSGTTKNVWIGAGGINIAGNAHYKTLYEFGKQNNDVLYLRPWHSDYTIGTRSGNTYSSIKISKETHFGTTDENGKARTVTANGKLEGSGSIYIEGTGRFVSNNAYNNNAYNYYGGAVTVTDTATLVLNKMLTLGAMTIKDGATLEIPSGATTGTSAVTLEAGSTLKCPYSGTALTNTLNLPTEGTATIRIDGRRLRSGDHEIATVGTGTNVALDPGSTVLDGRKGELRVDGTNLVLTINPNGFVILVR